MKIQKLIYKLSILFIGLMFFTVSVANATIFYSITNGNWNSGLTWSYSSGGLPVLLNYPKAGDVVYIERNYTVSLSSDAKCATLNIASGSTLNVGNSSNSYTLTVSGATSVSGNLNIPSTGNQSFSSLTVNSGGVFTITNGQTIVSGATSVTGNLNISTSLSVIFGDLTVNAGGILKQAQNYASANYLRIDGDLSINGTYDYSGYAPAIWMNGSGTHYIKTGSSALWFLLLRTGNFYANGPVTVNGPFYASWNDPSGSFHTNNQNVVANNVAVNAGGSLYVDGGSLTINNPQGLLTGNTAGGGNGNVVVSGGTFNTPAINMGLSGSYTSAFSQTGGTIVTGDLSISNGSTFTETAGSLTVNNNLNINDGTSQFNHTTGTSTVNIKNLNNNGIYTTGTGSASINISGNLTNNNTFTTTPTSTVTFNGSANSSINGSASTTFYDLIVNKTTSGSTITNGSADKAFSVNNNLTVTSGNLVLAATNSDYTFAKNVTVATSGTLTHSVSWDGTGKKIGIGGNLEVTGIFNPTVRSQVQLNGSGAHTIQTGTNAASTLSMLALTNGNFTASGPLKTNQEAYIMAGTAGSFTTNGKDVTLAGLWSDRGTITVPGGTLTVNGYTQIDFGNGGTMNVSGGTINFNGNFTINTSGAVTFSNSPQINITGVWINSGTFTPGNSTVTFKGTGNQAISGTSPTAFNKLVINPSPSVTVSSVLNNISIKSDLTVSSGTFNLTTFTCNRATAGGTFSLASGASLKVAGANNFPQNFSTYSLNANSTVEYYGAVAQSVYPAYYGNLTISGNSTKTAAGMLSVAGDLNINSPAFLAGSGAGTDYVKNITIQSGGAMSIGGGTLQVSGAVSISGSLDATEGTLEMNGSSAQTIAGNAFANKTIKNLIVSNTSASGLSVSSVTGDTLKITGALTFGNSSSKLNTGDNITLVSNSSGTARVGIVGTGNSISGKVIAENYMNTGTSSGQHAKAWQFLSVATSGQTIKQSWMENGDIPGNYGTMISGPAGTAAGFDMYSVAPSMKYFDESNNSWKGVSGADDLISNTAGYMVFVRGDRSVTSISAPANPTVLRTKGTLFTGDQPSIIVKAGKFQSVGNPYASPIDFLLITKDASIDDAFYVYDPYLYGTYGVGGYQVLSSVSNWKPVPGGTLGYPTSALSSVIQSGQAFFVHSSSAVDGSLTITEDCKSSVSRPGHSSRIAAKVAEGTRQFLNASLITANGVMADGNLVAFDKTFKNDTDGVLKMTNSGENFALKSAGKLLAIEAKNQLSDDDTIYYNVSNLKRTNYKLIFAPENFEATGFQAFLVDKFLNTETPVSLTDSTLINISVTSDSKSSASDRFKIVFRQMSAMPVTITSITATAKEDNNLIQWTVENESNILQYEVERSTDGNHFAEMAIVNANNTNGSNYSAVDKNVNAGINYYRIKIVSIDGKPKYTSIVKVNNEQQPGNISVYPNPVNGNEIHLQFNHQPAGNYQIKLYNAAGQVLISKNISHEEESRNEDIRCDNLAKGIYHLQISRPDEKVETIKVIK